jgi:hypothetical protein
MDFYVAGGQALGVHGPVHFFDVLAHAGLILFQNLRLSLARSVWRDKDVCIPKTGTKSFAAVPIADAHFLSEA